MAGTHAPGLLPRIPAEDASATIDRIALGSATIRSTETDDINTAGCVTSSSAVVPAALGMLASGSGSAGRLAEALAIGHEVMIGFAEAIRGPYVLVNGVWPSCAAAPLAAAAVGARCLRLTSDEARHALVMALAMTSGRMAPSTGVPSFRWHVFGQSVRAGLLAALAARAGYTANPDQALGAWLDRWLGRAPALERLRPAPDGDLRFRSSSLKPFCAAKQVIAAIEAFRRILARGVDPRGMTEVVVAVPSHYERMVGHPVNPNDRLTMITNVSYQLALAALAPDDLFNIIRFPPREEAGFRALADRIRVVADRELDTHYPRRFPARVRVHTASGSLEETVLDAPGDPGAALTEEQVRSKALRLMAPAIGPGAAGAWFDGALAALEDDAAADITRRRLFETAVEGTTPSHPEQDRETSLRR